jgi:hypothetical protein
MAYASLVHNNLVSLWLKCSLITTFINILELSRWENPQSDWPYSDRQADFYRDSFNILCVDDVHTAQETHQRPSRAVTEIALISYV